MQSIANQTPTQFSTFSKRKYNFFFVFYILRRFEFAYFVRCLRQQMFHMQATNMFFFSFLSFCLHSSGIISFEQHKNVDIITRASIWLNRIENNKQTSKQSKNINTHKMCCFRSGDWMELMRNDVGCSFVSLMSSTLDSFYKHGILWQYL